MRLRYLLLPGLASLFLVVNCALAWSQKPSARIEKPLDVSGVVAQFPPYPPPPPPGVLPFADLPPEPPWVQAIDLSTDQRSRLQAIHAKTKQAIDMLQQQLFQAHHQMRSLMESDASLDRLQQQHDVIQTLHQQIENKHFATILEERKILTAEQRNRLTQWLQRSWQPPMP